LVFFRNQLKKRWNESGEITSWYHKEPDGSCYSNRAIVRNDGAIMSSIDVRQCSNCRGIGPIAEIKDGKLKGIDACKTFLYS